MVSSDQLKVEKIRKATILFIDNELDSLKNFIEQVRQEGFENVKTLEKVTALSEVTNFNPALIVLDLHGVAEHLDGRLHGLSILDYVKNRRPFSRIIVYSGNDQLDVNAQAILQKADRTIKKGTVSLKEFVCEVEEQVVKYYDPLVQKDVLLAEIENSQLLNRADGLLTSWRLRRAIKLLKSANSRSDTDKILDSVETIIKYSKPVVEVLGTAKAFYDLVSL